jgi:MFS family permease
LAARFSPSIEALLAKAGTHSEAKGKRSRAEWFALFAVCGELGAVLGPVAGALLTGLGFRQVALAGAGVFVVALMVLLLPSSCTASKQTLKIHPGGRRSASRALSPLSLPTARGC